MNPVLLPVLHQLLTLHLTNAGPEQGNLLFNLNTGIMRLAANPGVVRFARQWVDVQREKMLEALGGIFDAMDPLHRPHDQARLFSGV